ncbi:MAG: tetratricopeptide repeat protein [Pseudomonadota bacterium]
MVDIFQEVDEALQQDKLKAIWEEYKNTIVTAIFVLIGSTAASSFYQSWDAKRDGAETARFLQAVESDNASTALAEFASDTRRGHAVIAQMQKAALLLEHETAENKQQAAEIYTAIANQKSAPDDFRDLARILAVRYQSNSEANNALLKPLIKNEKNPFHWHARMEAAIIAANNDQDFSKALELLAPFETETLLPEGLKSAALALHHVYSQKQESSAAETKNEKEAS